MSEPKQNPSETPSDVEKPHHHHETHGTSDDIDNDTPVDDVKGPNVFERVKEEVEAVIEAFHPKKEAKDAKET